MARVVFADDDAALCYAARQHLSRLGHAVETFDNSVRAWEHLSSFEADVLIADLLFPQGQPHGLALAAHARSRHPKIRTVFITGNGQIATREGLNVILKPFDFSHLAEMIA